MKAVLTVGAGVLAAVVISTAGFAQTTGQASQPQSQSATSAASQQEEVTLTGCVQREADYRKAHEAGGGGVAGSGVGAGNEFVLVSASKSGSSSGSPTGTSGSAGESAAGTSGASMAYELTGPNEGQLEQYVGKRVEISGKLKAGEVGASGPTGGATAGAPPSGVDVTSKDLKLREVEVTSVRPASGTCPSSPSR